MTLATTDVSQAQIGRPSVMKPWWRIAIYPSIVPLSIVILIWGQAELSALELIRPAAIAFIASMGVTLVLSLAAGDPRLGGIAAMALFVALVIDAPTPSVLLGGIAAVLVVIGRVRGRRERRFLSPAAMILRAISGFLLLLALVTAAGRPGFVASFQEALLAPPGPSDRMQAAPGAPDIFVYLLDGYPGATASAPAPGFDASALPSALRARGFTVHDNSRTNYLITRIVVPTMLEGRHLGEIEALAPPFGPDQAVDARRLRAVSEHSAGLAAIRAAGYDVVWISGGASHLDIRNVDRWIESSGPSELEITILRQTGLGSLLQVIDPNGFGREVRARAKSVFERATALAAEAHVRPQFVFVHVPVPHPPTVFRADGSAEDESSGAAWDRPHVPGESTELYRSRTFAQVQAVADMTIAATDALRAASVQEPVIVLFSDHGTDIGFDPNDTLASDLDERTSTILAARTPGHPDLFAEPTTPVNILRLLTNAYAGTTLARRPDLTYAYDRSVLNVVPIDTSFGD